MSEKGLWFWYALYRLGSLPGGMLGPIVKTTNSLQTDRLYQVPHSIAVYQVSLAPQPGCHSRLAAEGRSRLLLVNQTHTCTPCMRKCQRQVVCRLASRPLVPGGSIEVDQLALPPQADLWMRRLQQLTLHLN